MQSDPTSKEVISYLDGLPLAQSLWWFIENATAESKWSSDVFFRLRERVRQCPDIGGSSPSVPAAEPKTKPVCSRCGSDNVVADASARWDVDTQSWDLTNVCDKGHSCEDCDASNIRFDWVPVTADED